MQPSNFQQGYGQPPPPYPGPPPNYNYPGQEYGYGQYPSYPQQFTSPNFPQPGLYNPNAQYYSPQGSPTAMNFMQPNQVPNPYPQAIPANPYFIPPKMPDISRPIPPPNQMPPQQPPNPPLPRRQSSKTFEVNSPGVRPTTPGPNAGGQRFQQAMQNPQPPKISPGLGGVLPDFANLPPLYRDIIKKFLIMDGCPTDSYIYNYNDANKKRATKKEEDPNSNNRRAHEQIAPKPKPRPAPEPPQPAPAPEANSGPGKDLNNLIHQSQVRGKVIPIPEDTPSFESGIFSSKGPAIKKEIPNDVVQRAPQPVHNSMIKSYVNRRSDNMLDDLQELMRNSNSYKDALAQVRNGKFSDPNFAAVGASIFGFGEGKGMGLAEANKIPWLRPTQFLSGQFWVYRDIKSEDIVQGKLGDCYFLAAISSIAEFPKRIERLFLTKEVDQRSIYVLAMCQDGLWDDVVLDDQFPSHPAAKRPIFSTNKNNDLWVLFMEKAWAKVNGGYRNIAAGLTREALRTLTGASCKTFFTDGKTEELWRDILLADRANFIMTAASDNLSGQGEDNYIEKIGLCGSHAYSLLSAYEIDQVGGGYRVLSLGQKPQGQVERVLKLRNPWGKGEWKGEWSDRDPRWKHPELAKLRPEGLREDGVFFITFNDFIQYFSDVQICYFYDDFKYSAIKIQARQGETVFVSFRISTPGIYYVSLNQKLARAFPRNSGYAYSPLQIFVAEELADSGYRFVANSMRDDFENWVKCDLKPGKFVVMVRAAWVSFVDECSLSVYGLQKLSLSRLPANAVPQEFMSEALKSHARDDRSTEMFTFQKTGFADIGYKLFDTKEGCGYVYFENKNASTLVNITSDFRSSQNIRLSPPHSIMNPQFSLEPNSTKIIVFEAEKFPYVMQMQISASFQKQRVKKDIAQRVKEAGRPMQRLDSNGNPFKVWVYALKDSECLAMLYVNQEPDLKFVERIKFSLVGARLEGTDGNETEVVVGPGKEKLIKVLKNEGVTRFEVKIAETFCWAIPTKSGGRGPRGR